MGWEVAEDGLKPVFSRDIPHLVAGQLGAVARDFLGRHGLTLGDIERFVCHPGGPKVIDALEHAFAHDDLIADTNSDLAAVYFGIEWILKQPRRLEEKIEQIGRLFALEGKGHIASMRDFTGWK